MVQKMVRFGGLLSCLIRAVAGRTFPAGERGSAAGSLLSSHCPKYTWACVLCRPSPELPFRFVWSLGWSTWHLALDPSSVLYLWGTQGDEISPRHRQDRARSSCRPPWLCACVCRGGLRIGVGGKKPVVLWGALRWGKKKKSTRFLDDWVVKT
jgi:hypothetical protein